ncbi:hypothetical protein KR51_00035580 [Rubidibacter lacunae KORDI 51-2]|uniref:Uncharacterized protein n=1 Tax=Rubidibacter lacunae KORDI 51-2 TaxID=582515 RepID=U5D5K8_9CHRO|nr:hypothetical protein KR51_00035580 [Rubidibacter lacunae KORDI 51-2]
MASEQRVREYLACWFQLGKRLLLSNGREAYLPHPIFNGKGYSQDFERCWQLAIAPESGICYLEGTDYALSELLSPAWELPNCVRCEMPLPVKVLGVRSPGCPCADLLGWPDPDLPQPHLPGDSREHLQRIRDRVHALSIGLATQASGSLERIIRSSPSSNVEDGV